MELAGGRLGDDPIGPFDLIEYLLARHHVRQQFARFLIGNAAANELG